MSHCLGWMSEISSEKRIREVLTYPSRPVTADMLLPSLRLDQHCPCCETVDEE